MAGELIIMRHGRSVFNEQGRYAGWFDTPLSRDGEAEAVAAGRALAANRIGFDLALSSALIRASHTLDLVLEHAGPAARTLRDARFNERHYGAMQELTLEQGRALIGADRADRLMTDLDERPPARPAAALAPGEPASESLADSGERALAAWRELAEPTWSEGGRVLLVAHGGVLRAMLARLGAITPQQMRTLRLGTASPYRVVPHENIQAVNTPSSNVFTGWT